MKNESVVKISGPLERDAVRILRDVPGVSVEAPLSDDGRGSDVVVRAGDVTHVIEVKARRIANASDARQLVSYAEQLPAGAHLVVVARSITHDARGILTEAGIGSIDMTGAMRLDLPGLYLWREGRPGGADWQRSVGQRVRLAGKAGVATQALLIDSGRSWTIRDLVDASDVSAGLVHRLFQRLEEEQLVRADGAGPRKTRHVINPTALLDLWAEEMRDRGVQQLRTFRLARDPRAQVGTLSRLLATAKIDHAVSGAAAAARLAPFITSIPVTEIWVTEVRALEDVAAAVHAEEVREGHNAVFRLAKDDTPLAFRARHDGAWLANNFRIYLDLRADPRRGREQADRLREEVIGF